MPEASERSAFPDPAHAPADAALARGARFDVPTLLDAYRHGIFPWPSGRETYWYSPDPRAVFRVGSVHVSRTLARVLRSGRFVVTHDAAFPEVVAGCANRPGEGTWITDAVRVGYTELHRAGHAHSVEVWDAGEPTRLVGGIYGVSVGACFVGESMFHTVTDASKVALVSLDRHLGACGFRLLDVQMHTDHLASMGVTMVRRAAYLELLHQLRDVRVSFDGAR